MDFWALGLRDLGQLTLMPATTRPSCCQNATNSLLSSEPRMTGDAFAARDGKARVLHADVELVGVEVGDRVQGNVLAEHGFRCHLAAVEGIGPVFAAVVLAR